MTLALGACATVSPEARLRSRLIEAGVSPRTAQCLSVRMADRLSLLQLRRLQSLATLSAERVPALSVDQLLYRLRALEDPEIFTVTSHAALSCAVREAW